MLHIWCYTETDQYTTFWETRQDDVKEGINYVYNLWQDEAEN